MPFGLSYSPKEMKAVKKHIAKYFGKNDYVLHSFDPSEPHVDIIIIPPQEKRPFYTLVTLGMGALYMNLPEEVMSCVCPRAELLLYLPADWKLDEESIKKGPYGWPISCLHNIALLPSMTDSWLTVGHSISSGTTEPIAPGVRFNSVLLLPPNEPDDAYMAEIPGEIPVVFYQLYPLYPEEHEFALTHNSQELMARIFQQPDTIINPSRPVLTLPTEE